MAAGEGGRRCRDILELIRYRFVQIEERTLLSLFFQLKKYKSLREVKASYRLKIVRSVMYEC